MRSTQIILILKIMHSTQIIRILKIMHSTQIIPILKIMHVDSQLTKIAGLPINKIASSLCIYKIFNVPLTC